MSAKSFTPGPWEAYVMTREVSVESDCGRVLFLVSRECDLETIADAHLIAAAPDFYEGAEELIAYEYAVDRGDDVQAMLLYASASKKLRAAIAKAKGETA